MNIYIKGYAEETSEEEEVVAYFSNSRYRAPRRQSETEEEIYNFRRVKKRIFYSDGEINTVNVTRKIKESAVKTVVTGNKCYQYNNLGDNYVIKKLSNYKPPDTEEKLALTLKLCQEQEERITRLEQVIKSMQREAKRREVAAITDAIAEREREISTLRWRTFARSKQVKRLNDEKPTRNKKYYT